HDAAIAVAYRRKSVMRRSVKGARLGSLLGVCLIMGTSGAHAQAPSDPASSSDAPGVASESLPPGVEVVSVGDGAVLVGQTGTGQDVALEVAASTAASAELAGRSVGIVLFTGVPGQSLSPDTPEVIGTRAAIERLGAVPVICDAVQFRRRQARCGRKNVDAMVVIQVFPGSPFEA